MAWAGLVAATILTPGVARASISLIQHTEQAMTATGQTTVTASLSGVTAGNMLVAIVTTDTNATITAPSTGWTTNTPLRVDDGARIGLAVYYYPNYPSSGTVSTTWTFSVTTGSGIVQLMELSGVVSSSPLDVSGTSFARSRSATAAATAATTVAGDFAILAYANDRTNTFGTSSAPYADIAADKGTTTTDEQGAYYGSIPIGTTVSQALSISGTSYWTTIAAVFKAAPLYWRGGLSGCASGSTFTTTTCWSKTSGGASASTAPGIYDIATFDGGGTGNCALSGAAATQVGGITMSTGYTGTITQSTSQNVSLAGDLNVNAGTFTGASGKTIATNQSGAYIGNINVGGGAFNGNGATVAVQSLTVSSGTYTQGSGAFSTNNGGDMTLSGGTTTFAGNTSSFADVITTSGSSTSLTFGAGAPTVTNTATFNGGTIAFGSGQLTAGGLDVEGATVTLGSSASTTTINGTITVGSGTLNLTNSGAATDLTCTGAFTQSGGTVNVRGAKATLGTSISGTTDALVMSGGAFNNTTSGGVVTIGTTGNGGNFNQSGSSAVYTGLSGATETINGTLTVTGSVSLSSGATMNGGSAAQRVVTIPAGGTLSLLGGFSFPSTTAMTIAGTLNAGTGAVSFTPNVTVSGTLNGQTGTQTFSGTLGVSGSYDGSTGTQHFANAVTVTGTLKTGTANLTGSTNATKLVTVSSGGTMTLASSGFAFGSASTMTVAGTLTTAGTTTFSGNVALTGTLNAGGTNTFNGNCALTGSGAFNANAATTTFAATGTFSMGATTTAFNGNAGTTTFAAAPTLTSGTFTVGDAGTSGKVTFSAGASFPSGMTLAFPTSGGTLSAPGQTVTINGGTVTSSAGAASTQPKITGAAGSGVTVTISSGTLNVDGLEFDYVVAGGVTIANGVGYTLLSHLTFKNNIGGTTSTHLAITLATGVIAVSGCYFDTTATNNVTLYGTSGNAKKAHAVFEFQSTALNGSGAGESRDADGDTNDDNVGDTTTAPYYGSVVEWTYASPADISGTSVGPPTAVFNWNTYAYEGMYVSYNNIASGTTDRLWKRNTDGSSAYYFDIPAADGDIVGNPRYDTILNESLGDVDGDGLTTSTNVRVVYVATASCHIIKLIDDGSSKFYQPTSASNTWHTDFTSASCGHITSQLVSDKTNLYFGGDDGTATHTKIFGVQIAQATGEKTLVKNIGTVGTGAITTAPSWTTNGGATDLYIGTAVSGGIGYVYRAQVSPGATIDQQYTGSAAGIAGGVVVIGGRAYAVSTGGKLYAFDASSITTTLSGFPYTGLGSAFNCAPFIDLSINSVYLGDAGGNLFVVLSSGAALAGYPYTGLAGVQITSTVVYLQRSGTMAVGASDGYAYFINRRTVTTGSPAIRKRVYVGNGSVTSISYNSSTSQYMAGSSDGHLAFINVSDVGTDSDGVE